MLRTPPATLFPGIESGSMNQVAMAQRVLNSNVWLETGTYAEKRSFLVEMLYGWGGSKDIQNIDMFKSFLCRNSIRQFRGIQILHVVHLKH